jgi:hypothetical protein
MLSILLNKTNSHFLNIFKFLILNEANPKIRNWFNQSPIEVAILQKNLTITTILFEFCYQQTFKKLLIALSEVNKILYDVPDFSLEMKWHFESFIPFLEYFSPSDVFIIRKQRNKLRFDFGLVGFSNIKFKKRQMSLLFIPPSSKDCKIIFNISENCQLVSINHSR